ncbi:MAG: nuclease [Porticoccaceae bacterium]|nr:nuclease [Porticoccaceae bacterium]
MNEAALESRFAEYVRRQGGFAVKFSPFGIKGFPDRIVLLPGGIIGFVELKNPNGKGRVSQSQRRAHRTLRYLGFNVIVSHRMEELVAWIDELIRSPQVSKDGGRSSAK